MSKWHAHLGSESRDCDGRYNHGFDFTAVASEGNPLEPDQFDVIYAALRQVFHFPDEGPVSIEIGWASDGRLLIHQSMATEEGYRNAMVTICDYDDYEPQSQYFRDHTAESMGY